MNLPDLETYRAHFIHKGLVFPLAAIGSEKKGLLRLLPSPPAEKSGWPWTEETDPGIYEGRQNWPKITIVTPSYNQGEYLEETIRAVLLQNYPNLEFIIMDGGSTDGTTEILNRYAPWISYWQSEKDGGQAVAINYGFSLASGIYYSWINSDDYYLKDVFHKVISGFEASKADFLYGFGYNYYGDGNRFELITVLPLRDFFIKLPSVVQPSSFWSARIHEPIWEELYCAIDFELWIRLAKGKKRYRIKEPLSVANIHDDAKTSNPEMKAKWDADEKKIWSAEGHGPVPHWSKVNRINRLRKRVYKLFGRI